MDEQTRRLLRAWQETGEGEEDYLRARLRAGQISWVRLETAAYLGDEAAQRILGEDALAFSPRKGVLSWLELLPAVGVAALYERVLLAAISATDALPAPLARAQAAVLGGELPALRLLEAELELAVVFEQYPPLVENSVNLAALGLVRAALGSSQPPPYGWQYAFQASPEDEVHAAVRAALLPALLIEDCPDPQAEDAGSTHGHMEREGATLQGEREARLDPGAEHLFVWTRMSAALAEEVLAAVGDATPRTLKAAQATAAIEAFALGSGWTRPRTSVVSPSGKRRIRIQARSLRFEVKEGKTWRKRVAHVGRETLLGDAGRWVLRAALAVLAGKEPSP